jgi:hypothetical protein
MKTITKQQKDEMGLLTRNNKIIRNDNEGSRRLTGNTNGVKLNMKIFF